MRLHWFSPLPPAPTEIARYTARILPALCARPSSTSATAPGFTGISGRYPANILLLFSGCIRFRQQDLKRREPFLERTDLLCLLPVRFGLLL